MLITIAYRITRKLLGALATVARRDVSKDVELLVLRQLMKLGFQIACSIVWEILHKTGIDLP